MQEKNLNNEGLEEIIEQPIDEKPIDDKPNDDKPLKGLFPNKKVHDQNDNIKNSSNKKKSNFN